MDFSGMGSGGRGENRTPEYRICSPVHYHFATQPLPRYNAQWQTGQVQRVAYRYFYGIANLGGLCHMMGRYGNLMQNLRK